MKKARTIAELHYPNKAGNRFDEKYRQSRINALEKLIAEQLTLTDVVKSLPIERPKLTTSYNELIQKTLTDVSQRSKLYFAFMEEYNALMGKSEHQILKEEVIVLLAKYSG